MSPFLKEDWLIIHASFPEPSSLGPKSLSSGLSGLLTAWDILPCQVPDTLKGSPYLLRALLFCSQGKKPAESSLCTWDNHSAACNERVSRKPKLFARWSWTSWGLLCRFMQHCINGHKETVQFFNYKRALCRHCLLMIYRERDVPSCALLIHAATINLLTDLGGGHHWPKVAQTVFYTCVCTQACSSRCISERYKGDGAGGGCTATWLHPGRQEKGHITQC